MQIPGEIPEGSRVVRFPKVPLQIRGDVPEGSGQDAW